MTYYEKLKDPRWQKLRLEVFERENWTCQDCGAKDKTLHAHHKFYKKGSDPWEYDNRHLMCVCDECHNMRHYVINELQEVISSFSIPMLHRFASIIVNTSILVLFKKSQDADTIIMNASSNMDVLIKECCLTKEDNQ
jgi:hypothetical protein